MKKIYSPIMLFPLVISILSAGCGLMEMMERETGTVEEPSKMTKEERKADKIADKLWEKIQKESYRQNWKMWPGKEAFYPGKEPHGTLLITYVNDIAYDAIVNKKERMPPEAIIIKENYTQNKDLASITAIQKIEGFNPDANDWYWVQFGPGGEVMTIEEYGQTTRLAGKIDECINCHSEQSSNDYLFTGSSGGTMFETKKTKAEETEEDEEDEEDKEAEEAHEEAANEKEIAEGIWSKIQIENYRENWKMWPGKEAFSPGEEPHGALSTTYLNDTAYDALENKEKQLPHGSILVKEDYTPAKELTAITVMKKIEEYNPEANDWYWVQYRMNGEVATKKKNGKIMILAGKVSDCSDCHARRNNNDYIFTSTLGEEIPEADIEEIKEEMPTDEEIADKIWNTMESEDYQKSWKMWPKKEAFYKGREPHGALLTTYVNDPAYKAIVNKEKQMPDGAIIIKENYTPNKELTSIMVMNKRENYGSEVNDWYWVQYEPNGEVMTMEKEDETVTLAGKVEDCIDCHGKKINNDYLYTSSLREFQR